MLIASMKATRRALLLAVVIANVGAGHALEAARMQLPEELVAGAERLPAKGYGGANRGQYEAGAYHGNFVRIESRLAVLDPLYAANRGKSSFSLAGPNIDGVIAGECRFKERVVTVGVLSFDAKKLAYVCDIEQDGRALGKLTLGEPKPDGFKARLLAREERRGLAEVGDVHIDIASTHTLRGSKLGSQVPVGYVLSSDGKVIGAVELTDTNPTFFLATDVSAELRRATLVAALALSVLRDPANSALAD